MKQVRKSALLWYSAAEMYALVVDVERYPEFLPWCERGEVVARDDDGMTARLHLAFSGLRHAFTTRNAHEVDRRVRLRLVDGPFSELDGDWHFEPLGEPTDRACRITFDLRYEFANRVFEAALSPVFDKVANTFVDAFVQRAQQVLGPR